MISNIFKNSTIGIYTHLNKENKPLIQFKNDGTMIFKIDDYVEELFNWLLKAKLIRREKNNYVLIDLYDLFQISIDKYFFSKIEVVVLHKLEQEIYYKNISPKKKMRFKDKQLLKFVLVGLVENELGNWFLDWKVQLRREDPNNPFINFKAIFTSKYKKHKNYMGCASYERN